MSSHYAATEQTYDVEEFRRQLDAWAQQLFATLQTDVTEVVAEQSYATTAFAVRWNVDDFHHQAAVEEKPCTDVEHSAGRKTWGD